MNSPHHLNVLLALLLFGSISCKRRSPPSPEVTPSPEAAAKAAKAAKSVEALKAMLADIDTRPVPESPKASRAEWLRATTASAYETIGDRNSAWDTPARAALAAFAEGIVATPDNRAGLHARAGEEAQRAVAAGCTDPLVNYLHLRFTAAAYFRTPQERAAKYRQIAERMLRSKHHPLTTLYVCLHAAEAFDAIDRTQKGQLPEAGWLRSNAGGCLHHALKDHNLPAEEAYTACMEIIPALRRAPSAFGVFFLAQEQVLHRNWSGSHFPHLIMGTFWTEHAWNARGRGYADTVTEEGWKLLAERLAKAEAELSKAWTIKPGDERIPLKMLAVELGQGQGRARMEEWFQRAMAINPASYDACSAKLYYLEPKWHGSPEAMLAFGRECVASKTWRGDVPLILVDAHEHLTNYLEDAEAKRAYWKQTGVWADIKQAYERFFALNPGAAGYHHNYALFAYRCEQWAELRAQLKLLGEVNLEFFGGKSEFEKMVRLAETNGRK